MDATYDRLRSNHKLLQSVAIYMNCLEMSNRLRAEPDLGEKLNDCQPLFANLSKHTTRLSGGAWQAWAM
eukprot:2378888-Karenia_brevis.AAC.1